MSISQGEEAFDQIVARVRPRLADLDDRDVPVLVQRALADMGPVRVTTFLPILVERRIRAEHPSAD